MPRKRIYVVWLCNRQDYRDDEWIKVRARTENEARRLGVYYLGLGGRSMRFHVGKVYTWSEIRRMDHSLYKLIQKEKPWAE